MEKKVKDVTDFKKEFEIDIADVLKQNEEQNRKIKLIELKDKISSLINSGSFDRALEYITIAKEMAPKDIEILDRQGLIYIRKDRYSEAEVTYKELLTIDPVYTPALVNLPELFLFQKKSNEYEDFKRQHLTFLTKNRNGILLIYLDALNAYVKNDINKLKSIIKDYLRDRNPKEQKPAMRWEFSDLQGFLSTEPTSPLKHLIQGLANHMDGKINGEALQKILAEAK